MIMTALLAILLLAGLVTLIKGTVSLSATKVVSGIPARVIGLLLLVPMPSSFALRVLRPLSSEIQDYDDWLIAVNVGVAGAAVVISTVIAVVCAKSR